VNEAALEAIGFECSSNGVTIAGEAVGEGPPIVALHGLTASRHYVVHRSRALPRKGYRLILYDARGHGDSDAAPKGAGYAYADLASDLAAVIDSQVGEGRVALVGHSMGAHTACAYALDNAERVAGLVIVGPVATGVPPPEQALAAWERLADGLERDGIEGFIAAYDRDLDPARRETLLRITRERLGTHRHPEAVARALREVPRSQPFDGLGELELLDVAALVVASHDDSDPAHPHTVAEAWAQRLPRATLISEGKGESPLAWQGGRLSREIASLCERRDVAERLAG
jgi:pimeloyl-ACP methyl ester carboxylesterase